MKEEIFRGLRENISRQRKIFAEINTAYNYYKKGSKDEKKVLLVHIKTLESEIFKVNEKVPEIMGKIILLKTMKDKPSEISRKEHQEETLDERKEDVFRKPVSIKNGIVSDSGKMKKGIFESLGIISSIRDFSPTPLEKETLKRLKKERESEETKRKTMGKPKANPFITIANRLFSNTAQKLVSDETFKSLEKDLIKSNLRFTAQSYVSVVLLGTVISVFAGFLIAMFFMFFSIQANFPMITKATGELGIRLLKAAIVFFVVPILTFLIMIFYPSLERSSSGKKIDEEIPFAAIHMSAISGSMIDPSTIFRIMISTNEYPYMQREFVQLINEVNVYGYDIVSALRSASMNSPSKRLSELFNGLATTITSGGDLPNFFEKRAQTLLFEHGLEKEKMTKAAETFMDIYISVVIAAPMILMILLMMMKISGLGLTLSTSMISLIMVLAVSMVNVIFLTFLQLKK